MSYIVVADVCQRIHLCVPPCPVDAFTAARTQMRDRSIPPRLAALIDDALIGNPDTPIGSAAPLARALREAI
jgi:Na+-translocating ferredoxin:NAD+ oxidoreductase RNF subunit RnfB